ncbi:MAG: hypothetical protein ABI142_10670 [Bryocella sp.]
MVLLGGDGPKPGEGIGDRTFVANFGSDTNGALIIRLRSFQPTLLDCDISEIGQSAAIPSLSPSI